VPFSLSGYSSMAQVSMAPMEYHQMEDKLALVEMVLEAPGSHRKVRCPSPSMAIAALTPLPIKDNPLSLAHRVSLKNDASIVVRLVYGGPGRGSTSAGVADGAHIHRAAVTGGAVFHSPCLSSPSWLDSFTPFPN
jgi:hypothetical protein